MIVMFGDCVTDASCIYTPNYPSHDGSPDTCEAFSQVDLTLHVAEFQQKGYDGPGGAHTCHDGDCIGHNECGELGTCVDLSVRMIKEGTSAVL